MRVRALTTFVDESGRHEFGDEFEMAEELAVLRIKAALVRPAGGDVRTATKPEGEQAVSRRRK